MKMMYAYSLLAWINNFFNIIARLVSVIIPLYSTLKIASILSIRF